MTKSQQIQTINSLNDKNKRKRVFHSFCSMCKIPAKEARRIYTEALEVDTDDPFIEYSTLTQEAPELLGKISKFATTIGRWDMVYTFGGPVKMAELYGTKEYDKRIKQAKDLVDFVCDPSLFDFSVALFIENNLPQLCCIAGKIKIQEAFIEGVVESGTMRGGRPVFPIFLIPLGDEIFLSFVPTRAIINNLLINE